MSHSEPKIQCSNPHCEAPNNLEASICERCKTPIVRRYLWSREKAITPEQKQNLINERYLALTEQIFLDTQPRQPPLTPEEVPPEIVVYLQLFAYYPHIPQPHGLLNDQQTWLFDYGTVPTSKTGSLTYPQDLTPKVENLWLEAKPLQQLNWLWQIAKLWHPLASKGVASSLLNADLIKINGQVLQLQKLQPDFEHQASLRDLGHLWLQWAENSHSSIQEVVFQLATKLETGVIGKNSQLMGLLDRAIAIYCRSQQYSYQTYALSDSGPSRSNNEDAAFPIYPPSQNLHNNQQNLAIVCDGVGGHDGGEIASGETIKYLHGKISALKLDQLEARKIFSKLTKYINGANDIISHRNDSEQRQERQRMGTTVVMALSYAQEIYLGHVGDSRIYWITRDSCHQMTIDDDLASREVRLGYALYRDSLQYPSAGALIQALGMRDSATLHPNLQRHIIDDECIFLLCTDGLSDFDRVEQQWRHNIVPLLEGKKDLARTVKDLITLANEQNGHDNVTVALVHCQIKELSESEDIKLSWSDIESVLVESLLWSDINQFDPGWSDFPITEASITPTIIAEEQIGEYSLTKRQPTWAKPLIFILLTSTIIGLLVYGLLQNRLEPDNNSPPSLPETDSETGSETDLE